MRLDFCPLDITQAKAILAWSYDAPLDFYNNPDETAALEALLKPEHHYTAVSNEGEFIGFCCVGADARVPGGDYETNAIDVGAGLRPDLVGQGIGRRFLDAVFAFVADRSGELPLRVTIAAFNTRALRLVEDAGFVETTRCPRGDYAEFVVLERGFR